MGKIKSILIKMQDEDIVELDASGNQVIPEAVYLEAAKQQASQTLELEQDCEV